jgi:hypothetical protein
MNALFDRFTDSERRTLLRLAVASVAVLAVFLTAFVRLRGGLQGERTSSVRLQEAAQNAARSRDQARIEWKRWEEAGRDLAELRAGYFYDEAAGVQALRRDLERIFAQAGTTITDISYGYADLEKEQVRRTLVTFTYGGTYPGLKKLLAVLEAFPKFLVIEKIEFPRTSTGGGRLSAKLTLAGYYGY